MSDISVIGVLARIPEAAVSSRSSRFAQAILPGGTAERKGKPVVALRQGLPYPGRSAAAAPSGPG